MPDNIATPHLLLRALQDHDWDYEKSDDFRMYQRGKSDEQRIARARKLVPNGDAIYKHYVAILNLVNYGHE